MRFASTFARIFRSASSTAHHQKRRMTADEIKHFERAFAKMDEAFAELSKAFDK